MKGKKYPFLIAKTDRSDKPGTHWWSILDIDSKKDFLLLDSFGMQGLRNFIVQDYAKIKKKILKGVPNIAPDKTELNLVNVNFSADAWIKIDCRYQKQLMNFFILLRTLQDTKSKKI